MIDREREKRNMWIVLVMFSAKQYINDEHYMSGDLFLAVDRVR